MRRSTMQCVLSGLFLIMGYTYTDAQNCCRLIVQQPSTVYLNFQSAYAQPQNRGYQQSYQQQQSNMRVPVQSYNQAYQNQGQVQQQPIVNSGYSFVSPQKNGQQNVVYEQNTYANGVENKVFGVAQAGAVNYLNPQVGNSAYAIPGNIPQRDQNQSTAAGNGQGTTYYVSSTYAGNQMYPSMVQNPSNVAPVVPTGAQSTSGMNGASASTNGQYVQSTTPSNSRQYDQSSAAAFGATGGFGQNQQGQINQANEPVINPSNQQPSFGGVNAQNSNTASSGGLIYGQGNLPNNQQGSNGQASGSTIYPSSGGSTGYPSTATPYQSTSNDGSIFGTTPAMSGTSSGYGSTTDQGFYGQTTMQPGENNNGMFVAPVGAASSSGQSGAAFGQNNPQTAQSSGTIYGQANNPNNQQGFTGTNEPFTQGSTVPNEQYQSTSSGNNGFTTSYGTTGYQSTPNGMQTTEGQQFESTTPSSTMYPTTQSGISAGAAAGIGAAAGAGAAVGAAAGAAAGTTQQSFNDGVGATANSGSPYQFSTIHPNTVNPYGTTNSGTMSTGTPQQGMYTSGSTPQNDGFMYGNTGTSPEPQGSQGSTTYPNTFGSTASQNYPGSTQNTGMYTGSPTPFGNGDTGSSGTTPQGYQGSTMPQPGSTQQSNEFTGSTQGYSPQYDQSNANAFGQNGNNQGGFTGSPNTNNPGNNGNNGQNTQQNPSGTSPYTAGGFTPSYDDPTNTPQSAHHHNGASVSSISLLLTAFACVMSMHLSR